MAHWSRAGLALTLATTVFVSASPAISQQKMPQLNKAEEAVAFDSMKPTTQRPWGTDPATDEAFNTELAGVSLNRRHLATLGWAAVSGQFKDSGGMFSDFAMHLGVTSQGRFEGVIYTNSMASIVGEKAAANDFAKLQAFTLAVEGGESLLVPLSEMKSATLPPKGELQTKGGDVYFKTFEFPTKAYRMLGALPDKNRLRFLYRKPDGNIGALSYHYSYKETMPWAMSIGYAKQLSALARQRSAN